jgi:hypothetical protein
LHCINSSLQTLALGPKLFAFLLCFLQPHPCVSQMALCRVE